MTEDNVQYSDVRPREGGKFPHTLFCHTCRRWVVNTANHEMRKEGVYSHGHMCVIKDGELKVLFEEGIPEGE